MKDPTHSKYLRKPFYCVNLKTIWDFVEEFNDYSSLILVSESKEVLNMRDSSKWKRQNRNA
jgi:hypothetical protein